MLHMTGSPMDSALIASVKRWDSATGRKREAAWSSALATALARHNEKVAMEEKMDKQWDWLDANPDHPQHAEREDRLIATLRGYETLCDELRASQVILDEH